MVGKTTKVVIIAAGVGVISAVVFKAYKYFKTPVALQKKCQTKTPTATGERHKTIILDTRRFYTTDEDLACHLKGILKCSNEEGLKVWSIDGRLKHLYDLLHEADRVIEEEIQTRNDQVLVNDLKIIKDRTKLLFEGQLALISFVE